MLLSGMGVMGRFTRPLPLPAPLELPYPILLLPEWGLLVALPPLSSYTISENPNSHNLKLPQCRWVKGPISGSWGQARHFQTKICRVLSTFHQKSPIEPLKWQNSAILIIRGLSQAPVVQFWLSWYLKYTFSIPSCRDSQFSCLEI